MHVSDRVVSILTHGMYLYLTELGSVETVFLKGHYHRYTLQLKMSPLFCIF